MIQGIYYTHTYIYIYHTYIHLLVSYIQGQKSEQRLQVMIMKAEDLEQWIHSKVMKTTLKNNYYYQNLLKNDSRDISSNLILSASDGNRSIIGK